MTRPVCIVTAAGTALGFKGVAEGLHELDRYQRSAARRTVTLAKTEYRELPEGWQDDIPKGWTPQGGSPAMPKEWV